MRLFVAVVPPEPVREHLERALASVRGPARLEPARGSLRWADPDDRHLTVAFYGEVSAGAAEELLEGLTPIAQAQRPLGVRLRGAGVFDHRILWIGCGGDVAGLAALSAACVDLGVAVTGRADHRVRSRAHLTVARVPAAGRGRQGARGGPRGGVRQHAAPSAGVDVADLAHALAVYEGPAWQVGEIVVISSRPGEGRGGGPAYDRLRGYRLPIQP